LSPDFYKLNELYELIAYLFSVFDVNDLAAFIHSGFRINAVRHFRLASVFVGIELRRFQGVVSAASARAGVRMSSFWIWHDYLNKNISRKFDLRLSQVL